MGQTTRKPVTFYLDTEKEKARLLREAKRYGVTLTEYLERALKVGLPVIRETLKKAKQQEERITEETKVNLSE